MELLPRFELGTSSLPIKYKLFSLVVGCCSLLSRIPCISMGTVFSCCVLSLFIVSCNRLFFDARMGFVWFFDKTHTVRSHPVLTAFLTASRMICAALLTLSALAWVYIRRVTALSLWPSASDTLATSAPLVIATLANV